MAQREPLEVLISLTRTLTEARSLEDALQATTDAALDVLPGDHTSLRLLERDRRELSCGARSGAGTYSLPVPFRVGEGILGNVVDTGKAVLVEDTASDPRFAERRTGFPIRSMVAVPLVAAGQVVGVLSASSRRPGAFRERERDLAQLLANCTVPAIEAARVSQLAGTDELTGAYNHRMLAPRLGEEVSRGERYGAPFSVLTLDLDAFRAVNDAYGHAAGDEVLRAFAERVREEVRSADVLVRRGGEEFLLIMPSTVEDVASGVAERVRTRVAEEPFATEHAPVRVTVSIGVASWVEGEDAAQLEGRAEAALHAAKEAGRDRVVLALPPAWP